MTAVSKSTLQSFINSNITSNGTRTNTGANANTALINITDSIDNGYSTSFDNGDLSANVLTVTHALGSKYVFVQIWDNNDTLQSLSELLITATSVNELTVEFPGAITGTWNIICKKYAYV